MVRERGGERRTVSCPRCAPAVLGHLGDLLCKWKSVIYDSISSEFRKMKHLAETGEGLQNIKGPP